MAEGDRADGWFLAGRYRLMSVVGRGGMGTVWRGRDELLDRDVAVKEVLVPDGVADAERAVLHERTLREARATAKLNHPNIVTVHDVVDESGRPWIVMEFLQARSLQDVVDEEGPQSPRRTAELGQQLLAALRAAHGIGILHRDVKPGNVLLTGDGRAVLTDFGIAYIEGDTTLTQTGLLMGSPSYIAPERARGERAGPAADLWALGATLYTACEGRPPHDRTDVMSVLAAILTEDPPPPRNAGPLLPVLMGLLQRDPVRRMSAEAAAGLLAAIASGAPVSPPTVPSPYAVNPATGAAPGDGTQVLPAGAGTGGKGATTGLVVTIAVLAVAVVALVGFVVGFMRHRHLTAVRQPTTSAPPPAVVPSGTPESPAPVQTAPPALPAGWHQASGPGYTIGVPAGWRGSSQGRSTFWRDPASAAYVQVDLTEWTGDPYAAWEQWESEVLAKGALTNYERVDLRSVPGTSYPAADIEFTWDGPGGQRMHGVDRRVIANGHRYAVFVAIPESQWNASQERVTSFLSSFQP